MMFGKKIRALKKFWNALAYVPNLEYGNKMGNLFEMMQNEHLCLFAVFQQLISIHEKGGFPSTISIT